MKILNKKIKQGLFENKEEEEKEKEREKERQIQKQKEQDDLERLFDESLFEDDDGDGELDFSNTLQQMKDEMPNFSEALKECLKKNMQSEGGRKKGKKKNKKKKRSQSEATASPTKPSKPAAQAKRQLSGLPDEVWRLDDIMRTGLLTDVIM